MQPQRQQLRKLYGQAAALYLYAAKCHSRPTFDPVRVRRELEQIRQTLTDAIHLWQ